MLNLLPLLVVVLINEMRKTRFKEGFECPHCASEHVVRFGKYNGRQRYRCNCCSKTFTDTTNNVLYRTRKGDDYFLYSQKGQRGITDRKPRKRGRKSKHRGISREQVCVLVARDRTKANRLKGCLYDWFLTVN